MKKHNILFFVMFFLGTIMSNSQSTIAFQGFEGTAADNWGFTPPTQNTATPMVTVGAGNYGAGYAVTGTRSIRVGGGSTPIVNPACGTNTSINCITGGGGGNCANFFNGSNVDFAPIDISCYSSVTLSVAHRTHSLTLCSNGGSGIDNNEYIRFETSFNGGPWTVQSTIQGTGDCGWLYTNASVTCGSNPTVANPYVYNVPAGVQTIALRVSILRNRSDEVFYLDDLRLTGISSTLSPVSIQHINP